MKQLTKELKDRYPFTRPACKASLDAATSLFMQMGMNSGGGSCLHCKTFLHLEIDEEAGTMKAETFEEYLNREQLEKGDADEDRVD